MNLILGMSFIKMLRQIGPSIDPWGTPYELDIDFDMISSIIPEYVLSFKYFEPGADYN